MNRKNILLLFENRNFKELIKFNSSGEIVQSLSFRNGIILAYLLLCNDDWDENLQESAVKLLYEIRKIHPKIWNESWEYDALLGIACNITRKYDERYVAYKRAFDKTNTHTPGLLIELARCCICPGTPPISYDHAIELVLQALKDAPYADGIGLLSHIYSLKDDKKKEEYWSNILKNSNPEFISPPLEPKFLIEEYLSEIKKKA